MKTNTEGSESVVTVKFEEDLERGFIVASQRKRKSRKRRRKQSRAKASGGVETARWGGGVEGGQGEARRGRINRLRS